MKKLIRRLHQYFQKRLFKADWLGKKCFWLKIKHRPYQYHTQRSGILDPIPYWVFTRDPARYEQPMPDLNERTEDVLDRLHAAQGNRPDAVIPIIYRRTK